MVQIRQPQKSFVQNDILSGDYMNMLRNRMKLIWWEVKSKMKRGQDIQLSICSYVAEKPCGCLYKLTCCNAKFHSLFKYKLYL